MMQIFEPNQQKSKFYKVTETDNCNNLLFFHHDKDILPISNKERDPQMQQIYSYNSLSCFDNWFEFQ